MPSINRLVSITLLLLFLSPIQADLYKWVDDQGKTHYGDKPPKNVQLKKISNTVTSYTSVKVTPFKYDASLITESSNGYSKTVVMFSTSWCGYCKKVKRHFLKNNIEFSEYDIEKSKKAAKIYKRLNGRGVPVILIDKQPMNGFSAKSFDRIYYSKS
jgi:glutaredoxin